MWRGAGGRRLVWPHHQSRTAAQVTGVQSTRKRRVSAVRRHREEGRDRGTWGRSSPSGDGHYRDCRCLRGHGSGCRTGTAISGTKQAPSALGPIVQEGRKHGQRQLLMPDATVLPDATTTDGALLVLAIVLPVAGVLLSFALGGRYVERIAVVLFPRAVWPAAFLDLRRHMAKRTRAHIHRGGLGAPARHCVARRRAFGRYDGDDGHRYLRRRRVCACGLRYQRRAGRNPCAVRVLGAADGGVGRDEYDLPGWRSIHIIRRVGATDVRRGAAGLSRRPRGDVAVRTAISALRSSRLDPLSGRKSESVSFTAPGADARHRLAVSTHSQRSPPPSSPSC